MNKHAWFLVVIAISLVALVGSAIGCATTAPAVVKPTINSFAASPASISQGERTTISWDVSGDATITIEPAVGTVGPKGSLMLSPASNATYQITATNAAGSDTKSVSVSVAPVVTGKPDLVLEDFWLHGDQVGYRIANVGTAKSGPTKTYLYIALIDQSKQTTTWVKHAEDWVPPLAAGEELSTALPNFQWKYESGVSGAVEIPYYEVYGYSVKMCADSESALAESNEGNNCVIETWGQPFIYDFFANASLATWKSSNSVNNLQWPMSIRDDNGAVVRDGFSDFMTICPEQVSNGWILGRYGQPYIKNGESLMQAFTVPQQVKFTAKVGFAPGSKSTDGVKFALGYIDELGSIVFFNKMDVPNDGKLHDYIVDLSDMAGKKTEFFILVEANDSPVGDCVRVWEPKITEIEQPEVSD